MNRSAAANVSGTENIKGLQSSSMSARSGYQYKRRLLCSNRSIARAIWGSLPRPLLDALKELTAEHKLSVRSGDLVVLEGRWYVTHTGLLHLARRSHCAGISVEAVPELSDASAGRWVFKATVYRSPKCKGFVGYGDADPSNVSLLVRGAEMRVAETRAVNRALRKAYGIGLCSVEEIGSVPRSSPASAEKIPPQPSNGNGKLRDRLCQIIRQHRLDPGQVKLYAAEHCGTAELRNSTREQIESFINHLAEFANRDREALLQKLSGYPKKEGAA